VQKQKDRRKFTPSRLGHGQTEDIGMSVDDLHRPTNKIIEPTKNSEVGGPAKSMFDEFHKQEASNFIDIRKARELAGDKPAPGRTNADTGVAFGGAAGPLMRH
jgi:hypothetical protein